MFANHSFFQCKNMHYLFQNIYLLNWKRRSTLYLHSEYVHVKISFDLKSLWDKYRMWDLFFYFLQFKRETGFSDIAHNSIYLGVLISHLIGSKSSIAARHTIILPQRWSYFNELLYQHSYLAGKITPSYQQLPIMKSFCFTIICALVNVFNS